MEPIWIGSPTDVRQGEEARLALEQTNDSDFAVNGEIRAVSVSRWRAAQEFERKTWMENCLHAESDRNHEHLAAFDNYAALPFDLGRTVEVGCGPFTQLFTILGTGRIANDVLLLDPLVEVYKEHPNCAYKDRHDVSYGAYGVEDIYPDSRFDTAICINVLEHVQNAELALDNLYACLKHNGILVFHEKSWEIDPLKLYDVGHPIRVSEHRLKRFMIRFRRIIFYNESKHEFGNSYYVIMEK